MRMTPAHLQTNPLCSFDAAVRTTWCAVTSLLPNNAQWEQAYKGFECAGFGLRSAARHAEAAFLSSACVSRELRHSLDPAFTLAANSHTSDFGISLTAYNNKLSENKQLQPQAVAGRRQQSLSLALDEEGHTERLTNASLVDQATLRFAREEGAKDFRQAIRCNHHGFAVP
ncbi:unnamed protein product, partial [Polarella glacialis]